MPTEQEDTQMLITPEYPIKNWNQTICYWTSSVGSHFFYFLKGGFWIGTAIATMTTLNVVSNKINLNEKLKVNEIFDQLIAPAVVATTAGALIISNIKKYLTNFANSQFNKSDVTNFCNKKMAQLLKKPYVKTTNIPLVTLCDKNYEQLNKLINDQDNYKNEFNILLDRMINILTEHNIVDTQASTTISSKNNTTIVKICNEIFKIGIMTLGLTLGMFFSSSINIAKTEIADDNSEFEFWQLYKTLFDKGTILVSFVALIIFKVKFVLLDNFYENWKKFILIKLTLKLLNKTYNCITNNKNTLNKDQINYINEQLDTINCGKMDKMLNILIDINKKLTAVTKSRINETIGNETEKKWYTNARHLLTSSVSIVITTLIDSFYDITMTEIISANKVNKTINFNFLNILKILVSKENLLVAWIGQVGFVGKMKITNWCWEKFKDSYFYKSTSNCVTNSFAKLCCYLQTTKTKNEEQLQAEINHLQYLKDNIEKHINDIKENLDLLEEKLTAANATNNNVTIPTQLFNANEINILSNLNTDSTNLKNRLTFNHAINV